MVWCNEYRVFVFKSTRALNHQQWVGLYSDCLELGYSHNKHKYNAMSDQMTTDRSSHNLPLDLYFNLISIVNKKLFIKMLNVFFSSINELLQISGSCFSKWHNIQNKSSRVRGWIISITIVRKSFQNIIIPVSLCPSGYSVPSHI